MSMTAGNSPDEPVAAELAATEALLMESVDEGLLTLGVSEEGQATFSLTDEGRARVEAMGRRPSAEAADNDGLTFKHGDPVWVVERRAAIITGTDPADPAQPYRVSYLDDGDAGWPENATFEPRQGPEAAS